MSEHTKEPWSFKQAKGKVHAVITANGKFIAIIKNDISDDDGNRIVACVNACAWIDTEKLEGVNANKYIAPRISEFLIRVLTQQRDELLAAAKNLRDVKGRYNTEIAMKRLIEAIAKVESEK